MKMSTGLENLTLYLFYFGGSSRCMMNVFKWFYLTLYDMYCNTIIGYQGLTREVHNFQYYATKIVRRFNEETFLIDNRTGKRTYSDYIHIDESDCRVGTLVDRSVCETTTTGTGSNDNHCGASQKDDAYLTQRAVYSGYKKQHGLSSLML